MAPSTTSKLWLIITMAQTIAVARGSLFSASSRLDEHITQTFLPNVRHSIDDCHLRYYKYGKGPEPLPAFGRPAYLREFAHMAAVGWTKADGTIGWNCGGSLIWENYVLTAAHCAADENNVAPDVVRLGDINLYDSSDDQYAQQLKIVEIIRHPEHRFSSRYHDIALLRLEKNVTLHDTVAPGCLWNDEEIPFPTMEATGWGSTGFGQANTPILLKVSLSVVKKAECESYYSASRGLRNGLQDYQLCAGDIKMDTCPGDSGGPLQMKLLANAKMTPFIIAVTSFGSVCGQSAPGVYMKVSSYIPWIRSELSKRGEIIQEWSFKPYACALRYVNLREYEDDVVQKSATFESIDSSKAHMNVLSSEQTVKIHWPAGINGPDHCHGVIIDEDTVLTLAHCAVYERKSASHIVYQRGIRNEVLVGHRHPRWRTGSYYNDIGVLKMKNRFQFSSAFVPACIWSFYELPNPKFYVTGEGRLDLNEFNYFSEKMVEFKPQIVQLSPRADIHEAANCSIPEEYLTGLTSGLAREHLCFGNKPFLVPESCQMQLGAPLRRRIWRLERNFEHIYALNLFGRDCGFGRSAVATRVGTHNEWLKSILLPHYSETNAAVHFINSDLADGDHCVTVDGTDGLCTNVHRCPKIAHEAEINREVRFCNSGSYVCCPYENIRNETRLSAAAKELDDCESLYRAFHAKFEMYQPDRVNSFYHTVYVGMETGDARQDVEWSCPGTLITRNLVVSSAFCLLNQRQPLTIVNVAEGNPNATWLDPVVARIKEVIIHPGYNATSLLHNIGLVRLEKDIVPTAFKYPICLWQNETHTPFWLFLVATSDAKPQMLASYPMYNSDCEEYLAGEESFRLYPSELCTNDDEADPQSLAGDSLVWAKHDRADNTTTQYLIGTSSYTPSQGDLFVHTRIASYVPWIKSVA